MSAATEIPVEIPVRRYVKRWLLFHNRGSDLFTAGRNNDLALVMFGILNNKPYLYNCPNAKRDFPQKVTLLIGPKFATANRFFPSDESLLTFNNWVKDQLLRETMNTMEVARIFVPGFQRKQAVLDMMAKYDIEEDDWAYETIIKNLQRREEQYSYSDSSSQSNFHKIKEPKWVSSLTTKKKSIKELINAYDIEDNIENQNIINKMMSEIKSGKIHY